MNFQRRVLALKKASSSFYEDWALFGQSRRPLANCKVEVNLTKKFDVFSLKNRRPGDFAIQLSSIRAPRRTLFKRARLERVRQCPVCNTPTEKSVFISNVYGADYCQCLNCCHVYVANRLSEKAIEQFYTQNAQYASTYTDSRTIDKRIQEIVIPKARWMIERFESIYKRKPRTILDVGAGGGHFVFACKELGLQARGIEVSEPSRGFSKKYFKTNLESVNFVKSWKEFAGVDIVTFWGVLEHVPYPLKLLGAGVKAVNKKQGMIIAEVPRWESFGTSIQRVFSDSITRHLDPLSHIQFFTDTSLFSAFQKCGLRPQAAWYFGMDIYELAMQLTYHLNKESILGDFKKKISLLQESVDAARLSDTVVLAGVPQ